MSLKLGAVSEGVLQPHTEVLERGQHVDEVPEQLGLPQEGVLFVELRRGRRLVHGEQGAVQQPLPGAKKKIIRISTTNRKKNSLFI